MSGPKIEWTESQERFFTEMEQKLNHQPQHGMSTRELVCWLIGLAVLLAIVLVAGCLVIHGIEPKWHRYQ